MSFTMQDVNLMAAGASEQAIAYITEVLNLVPGEPVTDEIHQTFIVIMIEAIALLELQLRRNLKNPEAWTAARASIEQLVERISEKVLDKKLKGGIILDRSSGQ